MTDSILIVDDSTFIVEGLVALLKKSYNPIPSYGGEECLEILRTVSPSLIILDIMMEPMDGWETLARIKDNKKTRHIPVLMFSAKKISPEEAEAHRIIIDDFLTKPVNPKKLIEAIEKVLSRQESNKRITGSWEAAGVSREIIDEYLTIKTNLDVDVSLLAVMKKQLGMAYPDAENRSELERSITTLEARIAASHASLESFCREQGAVLPHQNPPPAGVSRAEGIPETPAAQPAPVEISPAEPQEELRSPGTDTPPRITPPFPQISSPEKEHPEPAAEPAASRADPVIPGTGAGKPAAPGSAGPGLSERGGLEPARQPERTPLGTELEKQGDAAVAGAPGSSPLQPAPAQNIRRIHDSLFEPYEEPPAAIPAEPQEPVTPGAGLPTRSLAANAPKTRTDPAVPPGGGTRTPSMKSPETTRREPAVKTAPATERPSPDQSPAATGSFFSRLIAAITGLFSKKRP